MPFLNGLKKEPLKSPILLKSPIVTAAWGAYLRAVWVGAFSLPQAGGIYVTDGTRVSTDEQTTALQLDALRAAGCAAIHEDSASGASRSRPGLSRALENLRAGDTLVVWRLDRLGRSLRDLLDHIDTGTAAGRMLYAVLGAVAQFERDVLRERTIAGMRAAKKRGEHIGRPSALSPSQIREAKKMLERGESPSHVARVLRVGRSTLYRAIA